MKDLEEEKTAAFLNSLIFSFNVNWCVGGLYLGYLISSVIGGKGDNITVLDVWVSNVLAKRKYHQSDACFHFSHPTTCKLRTQALWGMHSVKPTAFGTGVCCQYLGHIQCKHNDDQAECGGVLVAVTLSLPRRAEGRCCVPCNKSLLGGAAR